MQNMNKKQKESCRVILGIISIVYILYMWVEKDIITIYTMMPKDQVAPLVFSTIAISLIKVVVIAGGIFMIRWSIDKIKKR